MYKLGIDVGGTSTGAVLIDENLNVVAAVKNPRRISTGIMGAVDAVLADSGVDRADRAGHAGTPVHERHRRAQDLAPIAILRIGAPATVASADGGLGRRYRFGVRGLAHHRGRLRVRRQAPGGVRRGRVPRVLRGREGPR
ncbi:MAG: hydantoinase/oxoprolinase N-terminal domain-containing protein [Eggerthellaceae bacterium]